MGRSLVLGALLICLCGCREQRACSRMAELCGGEGMSADQCRSTFDKLRSAAGAESADKTARCVLDAGSCAGAAGCLVGGVGGGVLNEFLKGLGRGAK